MNHIIKGIIIVVAITSMLALGATSMIPIMQNSFAQGRTTTASAAAYDKVSTLRIGSGDANNLYI